MRDGWGKVVLAVAGTALVIFITGFMQTIVQTQDRVFQHEQRITTLEEAQRNAEDNVKEIKQMLREIALKLDNAILTRP